jgi:hypothetical protein
MLLTIAIVWFVLLTLFLIANKRWHDRMARMDADMDKAFEVSGWLKLPQSSSKQQQRIVSAGVRPYPE